MPDKCQSVCEKIKYWCPLKPGLYAIRDYEFRQCLRQCAYKKKKMIKNLGSVPHMHKDVFTSSRI